METLPEDKYQADSYLPLEVLSHIFEYLPFVDRQNASLVCRHWLAASLDPRLTAHLCISFDHISYLANKSDILRLFGRGATRPYPSLALRDCEITASSDWLELFARLSPHMRTLTVNRCDLSERMFAQMILSLRNLRRLELHCTNQLLMSGRLFEDQSDLSQLKLMQCDQLELVYNRYLSDRIIHRFFALCHRLRHLSLCNTNISFHRGLYKRFYPAHLTRDTALSQQGTRSNVEDPPSASSNNTNGYHPEHIEQSSNSNSTSVSNESRPENNQSHPSIKQNQSNAKSDQTHPSVNQSNPESDQSNLKSNQNHTEPNPILPETNPSSPEPTTRPPYLSETVLTFVNVLQLISGHAATLQSLDLSHTLVDNESLVQLATLDRLKLHRLVLTNCDQVSNEGFIQLFQHQPHLVHVDLSGCSRLTSRSIQSLSQYCTGLRELRLRNCPGLTDSACQELSFRLPHLELLDISHCISITGQGLSQLFLSAASGSRAPKLRCLVLSGLNIVPREFRPILMHCSQLRILDLSHCFNMVSDETLRELFEYCALLTELSLVSCEAITDWGLTGLRSQDHPDTSVTNATLPDTDSPFAHHSSTPPHPSPKLFLGSRAEQEIRHDAKRKADALLRMKSSGTKSGDVLTRVCTDGTGSMCGLNRVKGLTKLNLFGCCKITDVSLIYALSHLPHLQELNLGDIQQISSEGIQALCKNNYGIHSLKLNRCLNLRDSDIQLIAGSLKNLQSLDLSNCAHLTDASILSFLRPNSSLRSLYLQKCASITPAAVDQLAASLSSLHTILYSSPTSVDLAGDANIPDAPPLCRVGAIRRN